MLPSDLYGGCAPKSHVGGRLRPSEPERAGCVDGAGEGQGRKDSSRNQEGLSLRLRRRDPAARRTPRNDREEVRAFPPFLSPGVGTVPWKAAALFSELMPSALVPRCVGVVTVIDSDSPLSGAPQSPEQQG